MARSNVVWLLLDGKNEPYNNIPVAAFTVKHEMITWLDRNRTLWSQLSLYRMKDSPHPVPQYRAEDDIQELDITEVMK